MYIFNLKGLVEHLSTNKPTQKENLLYILGWLITGFFSRVFEVMNDTSKAPDIGFLSKLLIYIISCTLFFFIFKAYFKALYSRNGGDFGEYFLERGLAILFVATNRCLVLLYAFVAMFYVLKITRAAPAASSEVVLLTRPTDPLMAILALLLIVAIIAMMAYFIIITLDAMETVHKKWKNQTTEPLNPLPLEPQ